MSAKVVDDAIEQIHHLEASFHDAVVVIARLRDEKRQLLDALRDVVTLMETYKTARYTSIVLRARKAIVNAERSQS